MEHSSLDPEPQAKGIIVSMPASPTSLALSAVHHHDDALGRISADAGVSTTACNPSCVPLDGTDTALTLPQTTVTDTVPRSCHW